MNLKEQTLSLEQMQHLNELGLEVEDTAMSWTKYPVFESTGKLGWRWRVVISEDGTMWKDGLIPTLTFHEILEMLPEEILASNGHKYIISTKGKYYISYEVHNHPANILHNEFETSPLYAAYKMLCWVLENGYLNKG